MSQCQCLKSDGKQCSRNAQQDSQYCWQHKNCKNPIVSQTQKAQKSQKSQKSQKDEKINPYKGLSQEELDEKLLSAADLGELDEVRLLLKTGANPNAKEGQALYLAGKGSNLEVVVELLEAGADPHNVDPEEIGDDDIVNLLELAMHKYKKK